MRSVFISAFSTEILLLVNERFDNIIGYVNTQMQQAVGSGGFVPCTVPGSLLCYLTPTAWSEEGEQHMTRDEMGIKEKKIRERYTF